MPYKHFFKIFNKYKVCHTKYTLYNTKYTLCHTKYTGRIKIHSLSIQITLCISIQSENVIFAVKTIAMHNWVNKDFLEILKRLIQNINNVVKYIYVTCSSHRKMSVYMLNIVLALIRIQCVNYKKEVEKYVKFWETNFE